MQVGPMASLSTLAPKLQKINPMEGIKKQFSKKAGVEVIKGLLKLTAIAAIAYWTFEGHFGEVFDLGSRGIIVGWQKIFHLIFDTMLNIGLTLLVIGLADWFVQKYLLMKQLMMSKQEVKDEVRNMEGNQEIKQKVKQHGRLLATKQMLAAVPTADVILVNPTHYSVALQYDPDVCPAPRVVAKGVDFMALKIREIAKENRIPIYENPPLARTLYATLEVNQMVPPEFFVAVAEILAFVFQKTKGRGSKIRRQITQSNMANSRTGVGLI
jgi:flagellar biosynthetic protein FlhB